jgi:hypothetical protein
MKAQVVKGKAKSAQTRGRPDAALQLFRDRDSRPPPCARSPRERGVATGAAYHYSTPDAIVLAF